MSDMDFEAATCIPIEELRASDMTTLCCDGGAYVCRDSNVDVVVNMTMNVNVNMNMNV